MPADSSIGYKNKLLAALSADELTRLAPCLELVSLSRGACIYEPGSAIQCAYFPTTASVSLLYEMDDGAMIEIATVGNEGMVGVALILGGGSSLCRITVQVPGLPRRCARPG